MNSIVVPAFNEQVAFVKIGNSFVYPTVDDMEDIRAWVEDHRDVWPACRKELPNLFGYDIKVKVYPATNPNNKYVWMIKRAAVDYDCPWSSEDVKQWKEVFEEGSEDPNFIVFVWGGLSIKRLNKVLIPFL